MNFLDFLNNSPNIFIFQRKANKTNFWGVLFFIYIIIMIFITIMYIIGYIKNEKYIFEGFTFHNNTASEKAYEDIKKMDEDEELNPFLNITLSLFDEEYFI